MGGLQKIYILHYLPKYMKACFYSILIDLCEFIEFEK